MIDKGSQRLIKMRESDSKDEGDKHSNNMRTDVLGMKRKDGE
jgi:hypothetical protein